MNFRAAARRFAQGISDMNLSSDQNMDPTMQDAHDPAPSVPHGQDPVHTDGADPATPGGAAPFNGDGSNGEPVVDDPLWKDPQTLGDDRDQPVPHIEDRRDVDKTTLHNARRLSYAAKIARGGRS